MEVKTIIEQIRRLPLKKRFLVMEQTLISIKKEELGNQSANLLHEGEVSYLVSEKSLAKDWLSEEDGRWDDVL